MRKVRMTSQWARFWPWSRAAEPDAALLEDEELSAALRGLHSGFPGAASQLPAAKLEQVRELCRRAIEHRQLADELEAVAGLHRDSAARVGLHAASVLGVDQLWRSPELGYVNHSAALTGRATLDEEPDDPHQADVLARVLGPMEVRIAEEKVAGWGGQRVKTLFQYLLMHRRPVHREVLMELLWPGHTYSSARNNLNVCVYSLRRVLDVASAGTRYISYRDGCYALNRGLTWSIDRDHFVAAAERSRRCESTGAADQAVIMLKRAVSAYGGPLFDGDPAADWFQPERTALAELFHQVLERLATLLAERGDLDGAQRALEMLLRDDGCRESAHRLLMTCYARRGQRDQVARQFHRCIARLDADLEIAPSAETVELFHELTRRR
jgi:DNA-binding SARP family transcriptional activator